MGVRPDGSGGEDSDVAARALAALDAARLAADLGGLVQVPSPTGDERAAIAHLAGLCRAHGIEPEVTEHDLAAVRALPGHPGEEAPRKELVGLRAVLGGDGPRLCLCGHVDVVGPGTVPWRHGAWSGAVADGHVHGRGSVDMKGGVVAALHAMAAVAAAGGAACEVVLLAVGSEEDGGVGAFAALESDAAYDACLIPEPTDFRVICAHGGALTCVGVIRGVAAHAAFRREGLSAIDRYVAVHHALADLETRLNADVADPLMARLDLPYPVLVGRVRGGDWASSVPDVLEFEARVGVPVGERPERVRALVDEAVRAAAGPGPEIELTWPGGQFAPAATDPTDPFAQLVRDALGAELGGGPAPVAGVPYGADMRHFTERGIPCVMAGPPHARLAHAVDERVAVDDLLRTARMLVRTIVAFGRVS